MDASSEPKYGHALDTDFATFRLVPRAPLGSFESIFQEAFNEQKCCDVKIKTNQWEIWVHGVVLCLSSSVLNRALHSNFKEARENSFKMSRDGHRVASGFVQFCYQRYYDTIHCGSEALLHTGSLQDYSGLVRVSSNIGWYMSGSDGRTVESLARELNSHRLLLDVEMWKMGDIYDVPSLQSQAARRLEARLYEYCWSERTAGPILDQIAPVYEYTWSDANILRRLLFRGLRRFRSSIRQDQASWARVQESRRTVRGFDPAFQKIFSVSSLNQPDEPFSWPSLGHFY